MSTENQNQVETPEQQGGKVEKKFEQNMSKLMALFSGDKRVFKNKVRNDEVNSVVEELLKERKEETKKEFKLRATKLLDAKVKFDKFVAQKEQDMKKAIQDQMKEFNTEMESCFQLIENMDQLAGQYTKSLKDVANAQDQQEEPAK